MHQKYDKKMFALREELELQRKVEIHEIEERKNGLCSLKRMHDVVALTSISTYIPMNTHCRSKTHSCCCDQVHVPVKDCSRVLQVRSMR